MEHERGVTKEAGSPVDPVIISTLKERQDDYVEMEEKAHERENVVHVGGRSPVAWGIPFDELGYSSWMINMLGERFVLGGDSLITTESTYVVEARNYIHDEFLLKDKNAWLMMVDSDVILPRGALHKLLEISEEYPDALISGWYHKKAMGNPIPTVYQQYDKQRNQFKAFNHEDIKDKFLKGKTSRVAAVGAGCLLMPRSVAEALGETPYQYKSPDQTLGEDMALCRRLSELKIDIMVHWPMLCKHLGVGYI